MKILVTGSNGQLGQSFKKISGNYPEHIFYFADRTAIDITDPIGVEKTVTDVEAGIIINCAAYTAVDKAESEPEMARRVNYEGAKNLAEVCAKCRIPLIHVSTDYVFNGNADKPYTEEDITDPQGVYGMTKLEGERAVKDSGCDSAVVRTAWVYSEFGGNFVKTMLRIGSERNEISVVDDQRGTPTYAPDLAEAIMEIVEKGINGFNLYHYSNLGETTWCGFAKEIFKEAGMPVVVNPITTEDYPTPAKRPAYSVLSKDKLISVGVEIPDWQSSLKKCMAELNKN